MSFANDFATINATQMSSLLVDGALVGNETDGSVTIAQFTPLMVPGEVIELATRGSAAGAAFTQWRLLIASDAGLLTKRSIIYVIRRAAIDAYSVDVDDRIAVTLAGASFDRIRLIFEQPFDPIRLSLWLGTGMVPASHLENR